MKYLVSKAISDLRSEFEGGKSMSLDFYTLLERGARNMLDSVNPETLKRRTPVYGGVSNNVAVYYCPQDMRVPSAIYRQPEDRRPVAHYTSPQQFYERNTVDAFTIETINGVRFLLVRQTVAHRGHTIDDMNAIGTKVSDQPLSVNDFNYVSGTGALQRDFTTASATPEVNEISDVFALPMDISPFAQGVVLIPMVFQNAKNISKVTFTLVSSNGGYYTMSSLTDSVGDNFIDGVNVVRFRMAKKVTTGAPIDTQIVGWKLKVETKAGTETVIIDKITLQKSAHYYFEYYSNRMFIDGITGAWKELPAQGDYVHLTPEARDILHYETAILLSQGNTKIKTSRSGFENLTAQLARKYQTYWRRYPSTETPISYNSRDRSIDFPQYIGEKLSAGIMTAWENQQIMYTEFADNETPVGLIDGVNTVYTLSNAPNPVSSLMLWLNGVYQMQGVDYTLAGNTITFTSPIADVFAGLPFVAFYRYSL